MLLHCYEILQTVSMPLPEQIRKLKDAGHYADALRAIDARLQMDILPEKLRQRLILEKERLRRMQDDYPFDEESAFLALSKDYPTLTRDMFRTLDDEGLMDFLFFEGVKRYHVRFAATLRKDSLMKRRFSIPVSPDSPFLDPIIRTIRDKGVLARRITLESEIAPVEDVFVPGT